MRYMLYILSLHETVFMVAGSHVSSWHQRDFEDHMVAGSHERSYLINSNKNFIRQLFRITTLLVSLFPLTVNWIFVNSTD
jgi:hypothetical protein